MHTSLTPFVTRSAVAVGVVVLFGVLRQYPLHLGGDGLGGTGPSAARERLTVGFLPVT